MTESEIRVKTAIDILTEEIAMARAYTTPEEFQTILQWLADYVTTNRESRSEEPG